MDLLARVTLGLYWLVHDHEKAEHGDKARLQWTQAYAEMVESRVKDQLRMVAPPLILSEERTFFTEEDLQKAFSVKGKTASAVDAGIDFGDAVVLVEVVSASGSVDTGERADAAAFRKDVDKTVLKKASQLDTTATNLLKDPQPEDSPLRTPAHKIFPVTVRGGQFAVSSLTSRYIRERVDEEGLFAGAAGPRRVGRLCRAVAESRSPAAPGPSRLAGIRPRRRVAAHLPRSSRTHGTRPRRGRARCAGGDVRSDR